MAYVDAKFDAKIISIEFLGGFNDGRVVRTEPGDIPQFNEVIGYYDLSNKGTVGTEFPLTSWSALDGLRQLRVEQSWEAPVSKHIYRVIDREEAFGTLTIRCQFVRASKEEAQTTG